ncbi:MAG: hypothetical protein ABSH40_07150 [Bryobacteraceae bacterium]|jgi:hypothetical protein
MLVYPQLTTGALGQFPIEKRWRQRTVVNTAADGSVIKLADSSGALTEWQLQYAGLSDGELAALRQFFAAAEGTLNGFTFLDPAGNLFAWSDHLENVVWDLGSFLAKTGGVADPAGGTNGWLLTNSGTGAQSITQTLAAPGGYLFCLSAWVQAAAAATVTMLMGANRSLRPVQAGWNRIAFTENGDATATSIVLGLELPAGAAIQVYGLQAEAQAAPSKYKASTTGGVYAGARLRDDALTFTTEDVNHHSATVNILYASHL